jgi:predicted negative regulator of RcsB-dependent stress response
MLSTDFLVGLVIGVAAVYAWHHYQARQAGA